MYYAKKDQIKPKDIVANIYDSIELIIDITGINEDYIKKFIDIEISEIIFPPNIYRRTKTELYEEELNHYQKRNTLEMSIASKRRLLETESVYRFYAKNETEQIAISTMFISIKLDYKCAHILNDKINLISNIIKYLMQNEYLQIERITLNKSNSVICSSLYRLYQCFNKNLFGDMAYNLSRRKINIEEYYLRNESLFHYGKYISHISRIVQKGLYDEKVSYQGILQINMNFDAFEFEDNTEDSIQKIISIFIKLNSICYQIFIEHITLAFIKDLVNGKTDKVIGGFNKNEERV